MSDDDRRRPVSSVADLNTLDEAEIIEGYRDAFDGGDCGDNRSRSYWHGWRNGMMDRGRMPKDEHAAALAHEVIQHQRERGSGRLH